ncbi:unnamed protein product [Absidia cylindrospora]
MDPSLIGQDDLSLYTTDYTNDMTSQDPDYFLSLSEPIAETSSTTITAGAALPSTTTTQNPPENPTAVTTTTTTNDPMATANPLTFDKNEFSFLPQVQTIVQSILGGRQFR